MSVKITCLTTDCITESPISFSIEINRRGGVG